MVRASVFSLLLPFALAASKSKHHANSRYSGYFVKPNVDVSKQNYEWWLEHQRNREVKGPLLEDGAFAHLDPEIEEGAETKADADKSSPSDFLDLAADFYEATETVVEKESKQPAVSKSKPDAKHKLECERVAARYPSNIHVSGHHIGVWKSSVNDHQPGKVMEVDFTNIYDTAYAPGMDVLLFLYSSQHPDTKKV